MGERILELALALGGGEDRALLPPLCATAERAWLARLREGVTAEDCGGAYPLAAAWLAMDWLRCGQGLEGVTALSAGDISVRREGGGDGESLSRKAFELMTPYFRDEGFVFRGVRG